MAVLDASPRNHERMNGFSLGPLSTDTAEKLEIAKVAPLHDPTSFGCGEKALNRFIKLYARAGQLAGISQTYVVAKESNITGRLSQPQKRPSGNGRAGPATYKVPDFLPSIRQDRSSGESKRIDFCP
jgi:hypothetical protein